MLLGYGGNLRVFVDVQHNDFSIKISRLVFIRLLNLRVLKEGFWLHQTIVSKGGEVSVGWL